MRLKFGTARDLEHAGILKCCQNKCSKGCKSMKFCNEIFLGVKTKKRELEDGLKFYIFLGLMN